MITFIFQHNYSSIGLKWRELVSRRGNKEEKRNRDSDLPNITVLVTRHTITTNLEKGKNIEFKALGCGHKFLPATPLPLGGDGVHGVRLYPALSRGVWAPLQDVLRFSESCLSTLYSLTLSTSQWVSAVVAFVVSTDEKAWDSLVYLFPEVMGLLSNDRRKTHGQEKSFIRSFPEEEVWPRGTLPSGLLPTASRTHLWVLAILLHR